MSPKTLLTGALLLGVLSAATADGASAATMAPPIFPSASALAVPLDEPTVGIQTTHGGAMTLYTYQNPAHGPWPMMGPQVVYSVGVWPTAAQAQRSHALFAVWHRYPVTPRLSADEVAGVRPAAGGSVLVMDEVTYRNLVIEAGVRQPCPSMDAPQGRACLDTAHTILSRVLARASAYARSRTTPAHHTQAPTTRAPQIRLLTCNTTGEVVVNSRTPVCAGNETRVDGLRGEVEVMLPAPLPDGATLCVSYVPTPDPTHGVGSTACEIEAGPEDSGRRYFSDTLPEGVGHFVYDGHVTWHGRTLWQGQSAPFTIVDNLPIA